MDELDNIQALVCLVFLNPSDADETMRALDVSPSACLMEQDFREKLQRVLFIRRRITAWKWRNFFDTCFKQMLSSYEMYVTFVLFACWKEDECHQNKSESLLSVCSLVKFLSDETLEKTGVNFCHLNPNIFGVFYRCLIQPCLFEQGGFRRLIEYIRDHRFLKWEDNTDFAKKREKELKREGAIEKEVDPHKIANYLPSKLLANTVLKTKSIKLPVLPSVEDLVKSMAAFKKKKLAEYHKNIRTETVERLEVIEKDVRGCSSSNSHSKTDCVAKHQDSIEWHENIIQAVIRHNHLKGSRNENTNSRIEEEARVLEYSLQDKINSLIEVLDKYDKE